MFQTVFYSREAIIFTTSINIKINLLAAMKSAKVQDHDLKNSSVFRLINKVFLAKLCNAGDEQTNKETLSVEEA